MFDHFPLDLSWKTNDIQISLPVLLSVICFTCHWFLGKSKKLKNYFEAKYEADLAAAKHFFFVKCMGFFILGAIPLSLCLIFIPNLGWTDYGIIFIGKTTLFSICCIIGLSIILIPIIANNARKPKNLAQYPEIRAKIWTKQILFFELAGWAIYLFGYEILFRGVLLMPLVEPLGIWVAIAINTAIYAATHLPKNFDETIGAIPFGVVICLLTLASGTIWVAFFTHLVVVWTNSLVALRCQANITA